MQSGGGNCTAHAFGQGQSGVEAQHELQPPVMAELSGSGDEEDSLDELDASGDDTAEAATSLSLVGEGLAAVPADLAVCFPALRRLCLHGNAITAVAGLAGLSALQDLNLSSNSIACLPDGALGTLRQLTALNLASNCLARLGSAALSGLPRLRRLSLAHNSLPSLEGLAALHGGPLEWLDVRNNAIASLADFSVLAGLPRLAELHVGGGSPGALVPVGC